MALDVLLRFDAWLERYSGPNLLRANLISDFSLILVASGLTGYLRSISRFSPDSWSYYEPVRTGFDGKFYSFNTWRSYFAETFSASFHSAWDSYSKIQEGTFDQDAVFFQVPYECHLQHPEQTFIFSMPSMTLPARYGATTGMKTAFLPRNL